MGNKFLKLPITELLNVRVACKKCKRGAIEVPIDRLETALKGGKCSFCTVQLLDSQPTDALNDLRLTLDRLRKKESDVEISFIVPYKD